MQDLSSPTRDWTHISCIGSTVLTTRPPGKSQYSVLSYETINDDREWLCRRIHTYSQVVRGLIWEAVSSKAKEGSTAVAEFREVLSGWRAQGCSPSTLVQVHRLESLNFPSWVTLSMFVTPLCLRFITGKTEMMQVPTEESNKGNEQRKALQEQDAPDRTST